MDSDLSDRDDTPIDRPPRIDVKIQFGKPEHYEIELIEGLLEPHLAYNCASEILLSPVITYLKVLGYPLTNAIIWYYSPTAKLNVYCGNDPLPSTVSVPIFELKDNTLCLICREAIKNEFGTVVTLGSATSKAKPEEEPAFTKNMRRTKERKISHIIEKVSEWRLMYNGVQDNSGKFVKLTLEEAASKVGISKKSLDDYLLQLRFGRKFGFNFQEHKDEKVGVLRAYVKKFKGVQRDYEKLRHTDTLPVNLAKKLQEPGTPSCKHNRCCYPDFALPLKTNEQPSAADDICTFDSVDYF